jgi:hypothetical protein
MIPEFRADFLGFTQKSVGVSSDVLAEKWAMCGFKFSHHHQQQTGLLRIQP